MTAQWIMCEFLSEDTHVFPLITMYWNYFVSNAAFWPYCIWPLRERKTAWLSMHALSMRFNENEWELLIRSILSFVSKVGWLRPGEYRTTVWIEERMFIVKLKSCQGKRSAYIYLLSSARPRVVTVRKMRTMRWRWSNVCLILISEHSKLECCSHNSCPIHWQYQ